MATSLLSPVDNATELQARIEAAEDQLLNALDGLPSDHPVALAANQLVAAQHEMRNLFWHAYEEDNQKDTSSKAGEFSSPHEAAAAIEIGRDAHTLKPDFKDVLKALFLWRDDPATRVRDKGEFRSDLKGAPL